MDALDLFMVPFFFMMPMGMTSFREWPRIITDLLQDAAGIG